MLVLTRKAGEQIVIGNDITITLIEVRGGDVRIGIDAPRSVTVHRAEVVEAVSAANVAAAHASAADEDRIRALLAPPGAVGKPDTSDDV
ncbi:carbon storage regulator [Occultella glacieicola]|uniref:Translational regulator CsrA n=1 Tax=Occultella glacieicola TaxID=2518684 RepID=A0ABY2E8E3_9MICO|nr:carbon storage regulator CsrA [Occultella glacieicola]TDE98656.1 carbon storage regulator [Occultella glacieicola]